MVTLEIKVSNCLTGTLLYSGVKARYDNPRKAFEDFSAFCNEVRRNVSRIRCGFKYNVKRINCRSITKYRDDYKSYSFYFDDWCNHRTIVKLKNYD